VTFASGQKLGSEPLLASGSRGLGPLANGGTRLMDRYQHVRGIGGSTLHFTGESHRLHPAAMKMKTRFGVAADWPFDYGALEPYYVAAEQLIGVAGPAPQGAPWRPRGISLPPHPLPYPSPTLGQGAKAPRPHRPAHSRAAPPRPLNGPGPRKPRRGR